jgi:hypothetical protein
MSDRMTPEQFSRSLAQLAKAEHTGNYAQSIASRSALALHDKELRSELDASLEALAVLRGRLEAAERTCRDEEVRAYVNGRLSAEAEVAVLRGQIAETKAARDALVVGNDELLSRVQAAEDSVVSLKEALREIIEASRDFDAPSWWVAVERIEKLARAALASSEEPT